MMSYEHTLPGHRFILNFFSTVIAERYANPDNRITSQIAGAL